MSEPTRLAKRVTELNACSRREAEQYIEGGWVQVDGQVIEEPGAKILPEQTVELMPGASLQEIEPVTILLNKPAGHAGGMDQQAAIDLITAESHFADDRSGIRFLKKHLTNLTSTDPLGIQASGLMVLTQNWRVARTLVEDAAKIEHEYIVEVAGDLVPNGLELLNHGLTFNRRALAPIKVSWQNETRLRFALKNTQKGQIVHMCEQVGLKVIAMKRIRIGRVPMATLPVGQWRYLAGYERF
jgi:23S rRNA pseudouridine2604 synthase